MQPTESQPPGAESNITRDKWRRRLTNLFHTDTYPVLIVRFLIGGGTAAVTHLALLYVFHAWLNFWYLYASALAFCVALGVSYSMQKFFVFRHMEVRGMGAQFAQFATLAVINLWLNISLMYLFVSVQGMHYLAAQILTLAAIAVWSFLLYRFVIFKKRSDPSNAD